jgi:RNA polymerase sigma-70 factor (ECF subfamily)
MKFLLRRTAWRGYVAGSAGGSVIRTEAPGRIRGVTTAVAARIWANCGRDVPAVGNVRVVGATSTDSLLAARIAAGDERALAEVFDALGSTVYATAVRVLGDGAAAQDVVQDVFVDLWCHPQKYDDSLGTLRTFLTVCARHRAHDLIRSELRRVGREQRSERLMPAQREASPAESITEAETASAVRDAVQQLPPSQREVVELAYFRGLSYRDVARATGVPEGTAKSRVRLALARLETLLDRQLLEST